MIRLIIAGGRKNFLSERDCNQLCAFLPRPDVVLCGMAKGIDLDGKAWAEARGIPVEELPAEWEKYGRARAGHIRNSQMAQLATHCVVFPGGTGTNSMFHYATWARLTVYDWRKGVDDQRRLFDG